MKQERERERDRERDRDRDIERETEREMKRVSFTELNDNRTAKSEDQDRISRMCRLILFYTLRKINLWSQDNG